MTELGDEAWDEFLESTPLGQFQQSSRWARVKVLEGWQPHRVVFRDDGGNLAGGFQLLWRPYRRFWRIGYVSKGPVLLDENAPLVRQAVESLISAASELRLTALLVQPPDRSLLLEPALQQAGFLPNRLWGVADANLEIDLARSLDAIEADFRRSVRQGIRQSRRRGVTIREARRSDAALFFDLMSSSCRRQGTSPNPASPRVFERMWDVFQPGGYLRLTLAEWESRAIAGLLCLHWADRVTLWKKGWLDDQRGSHANELLYWDAITWARERGADTCDFAALARTTAELLLREETPDETVRRSRDFFNLGFGGEPVLLPRAQVLFRSGVLSRAYRLVTQVRGG